MTNNYCLLHSLFMMVIRHCQKACQNNWSVANSRFCQNVWINTNMTTIKSYTKHFYLSGHVINHTPTPSWTIIHSWGAGGDIGTETSVGNIGIFPALLWPSFDLPKYFYTNMSFIINTRVENGTFLTWWPNTNSTAQSFSHSVLWGPFPSICDVTHIRAHGKWVDYGWWWTYLGRDELAVALCK